MLTLTVTLVGGSYEASLDSSPEWPPHPGRVFSALVAQAEPGSDDDDALRWLELQAPPVVLAGRAEASTLTAFVPTNAVDAKKDTHQTFLGRTAGSRSWQRSHPERDVVYVVWEQAQPSAIVLTTLVALCRRVPYLGRSTTPVVLSLSEEAPAEEGLLRWESPGQGSLRLRAPQPGELDALRSAFQTGQESRSVARWLSYGPPRIDTPTEPAAVDGPWPELLCFGFPTGHSLDGRLVVRVATAWKKALLARLGSDHSLEELSLLHGHHDGTLRQCAFLVLPFVGHANADGGLLGVAVGLSPNLPGTVRRSLLRLLGMDLEAPRLNDLQVPGLTRGPLQLQHAAFDGRVTVDPDRWTGGAGSRSWVSALPVVLDRYPHRGENLADHVSTACAMAGYPTPDTIEVLPQSAVKGALRLRRSDLCRRGDEAARPALHVRVTFAGPIRGPVILGHLRHLGLGLCLPGDRSGGHR